MSWLHSRHRLPCYSVVLSAECGDECNFSTASLGITMHILRNLAFLFFAALSSSLCFAQESVLIPCDGAPPDAVLKLPAPLDRWGQIYCTKFGHSLAAKEHWVWSFPGAFAPVHLPAQMVRSQPKEVGHAAYFKAVELVPLSGSDADDAAAKLTKALGAKPDSAIANAYRLTLTNQAEQKHVVLFVQTVGEVKDGKSFWSLWCDAECNGGMPFMLLNYEGMKR